MSTSKDRELRRACCRVDDPYGSFLKVLVAFNPPKEPLPPGIHPSAVISSSAKLGQGVRIGAHVVIGDGCTVARGDNDQSRNGGW